MDNKSLFREKSMERITSPDQMRDHMRVTNPRLWMLLGAIVLLLAGFIIFAAVCKMESTYPLKMDFISADLITGEIPYEQMDHFSVGMPVRIAGETGHIRSVYSSARVLLDFNPDSKANFEEGLYVMSIGEKENVSIDEMYYLRYSNGQWTCPDVSVQGLLEGHDTRVRIWPEEITHDPKTDSKGWLATVSGAKPYVVATAEAILDNKETSLKPGTYDAQIVTESTTPISFLLN